MTPLQKLRTILVLPVLVLRALVSGRRITDPSGRGTITCTIRDRLSGLGYLG